MVLRPRPSLSRLTSWFHSARPNNTSTADHLIWIFLAPASHNEDLSLYNADIERLRTTVSLESSVTSVLQLRNTSPSRSAVYISNVPSAKACHDSLMIEVHHATLDTELKKLHGLLETEAMAVDGTARKRAFQYSMTSYTLTQRYEPRTSRGANGTCIVTVAIESTLDQLSDIEAWYRKDVLPPLGATSPKLFLRSRRYMTDQAQMVSNGSIQTVTPLAVHEFTSVSGLLQHSLDEGPVVEETVLGRRVLDSARRVERVIWEVRT